MHKNIVIIQGHPDCSGNHLCHALADAYGAAARTANHRVTSIDVGKLDFPVLRSADDWNQGSIPPSIVGPQQQILAADHLVIFYPLWLGTMPALFKAFLEQAFRPTLVPGGGDDHSLMAKLLKGKSVRIVVTMGMPALAYRLFFRAHSLKSLQRNILGFIGAGPIRSTLIGLVDSINPARAKKLFRQMENLGRSAL